MFERLAQFFASRRRAEINVQPHMTFGQSSFGRSLSRASLILKKQLWVWPIIAVFLLAAIGFGIRVAIERTMKANLRSQLQTLLHVQHSMIETWLRVQESSAESLANDQQVREVVAQLVEAAESHLDQPVELDKPPNPAIGSAGLNARLERELSAGMSSHQFVSFFIANKQQRVMASSNADLQGKLLPEYEDFLTRTLEGSTTVTPPFPSFAMMKDEFGRVRTGVPTMYVIAPIRDMNLQVIAALALRIRPELEFTRILQLGRAGNSGETYAINKSGTMVSNSRFDNELILLGLLPDADDSSSILNIAVRDPGGNMTTGFRPNVRRAELPLTKAAADAVTGNSGIDVEGYNGYRGVPKVGAWEWLPKYQMGIITELDYAEAFRPLMILRWAFFSMFGVLTLSSVAIFIFTLIVAKLQREAREAAIEAKQLGQYRLEARLGAGAMGVVYKGHHGMLRRATAIKLLNADRVTEASIERFEREVQITCKLNNPHTVAIYDYGSTPEGVFYYAMEYLDGIDLQALVDRFGVQPQGRVVRILQQICGSLYEAHSLGLVHRDIKPANIMLNRRGGDPDVVKVLDFGLVKALNEKQSMYSGGLAGTPLYMSPEAIQSPTTVDPRSDIYSVGAVGYFLLTGQPVFNADTIVELCRQHVTEVPAFPQQVSIAISAQVQSALLACLEKNPAKRPQTARDLSLLLERTGVASSWTLDDAEAWWGQYERAQAVAVANSENSAQASGAGGIAASANRVTGPTNGSRRTVGSGFDRTIAR